MSATAAAPPGREPVGTTLFASDMARRLIARISQPMEVRRARRAAAQAPRCVCERAAAHALGRMPRSAAR